MAKQEFSQDFDKLPSISDLVKIMAEDPTTAGKYYATLRELMDAYEGTVLAKKSELVTVSKILPTAPAPTVPGLYEFTADGTCSWITAGAVDVNKDDKALIYKNGAEIIREYRPYVKLAQELGDSESVGVSQKSITKYIRESRRAGVEFMNYISNNGTAVQNPIDGIYTWDQPIEQSPAYVNPVFKTFKYKHIASNAGNYTPTLVFVKNAKGANNVYRSLIIVDDENREIYQTNRSGDFAFIIYHNWTIQATCEQLYAGSEQDSISTAISSAKKWIDSNANLLKSFNRGIIEKFAFSQVGAENGLEQTTIVAYPGENGFIGIKQTTTVDSNAGYSYAWATLTDQYSKLAAKKFRFILKADKDCSFTFRLTNGQTAWGGGNPENGTGLGICENITVIFNSRNSYTVVLDIDFSKYSEFYESLEHINMQYVTAILTSGEGSYTQQGTYAIKWLCYDLGKIQEDGFDSSVLNDYMIYNDVYGLIGSMVPELSQEPSYSIVSYSSMLTRGSLSSIQRVSSSITKFKKTLGIPNEYVAGIYIKFDYDKIEELNKQFFLNLMQKENSEQFNTFYILKQYGDWGPGTSSVALNLATNGKSTINIYDEIVNSGSLSEYSAQKYCYILLGVFKGFDLELLEDIYIEYDFQAYFKKDNVINIATDISDELRESIINSAQNKYITCWGDSLTAMGGWTNRLSQKSGIEVFNGGTGGESSVTIMARQGGDIMVVNNITIPATATPVVIADRDVTGEIKTYFGKTASPLLQGGPHVNPCYIGDIKGTLAWTGSSYADMTGNWTFTRTEAGDAVEINRPTAIRTDFDLNKNSPHLMIIFMGQNGGYDDLNHLIWQHRKMIQHANAKHVLVLGLSSGTSENRADYESAMEKEFGRYFLSLRKYLAHPTYQNDGVTIKSCYGLEDSGLTPTQQDLNMISVGSVPQQMLSDAVHYTELTRTVIGDFIYKSCKELNIL